MEFFTKEQKSRRLWTSDSSSKIPRYLMTMYLSSQVTSNQSYVSDITYEWISNSRSEVTISDRELETMISDLWSEIIT